MGLSLAFLSLSLVGCGGVTRSIRDKYAEYFISSGDNDNPTEVGLFCWQNESDEWFTILLDDSNNIRSGMVAPIEFRQRKLACPAKTMKKILSTYTENERKYSLVYLISNPIDGLEIAKPCYVFLDQTKDEVIAVRILLGLPWSKDLVIPPYYPRNPWCDLF